MINELLLKSLHEVVRPDSVFQVIDDAIVAIPVATVAVHKHPPPSKFAQLTSLIFAYPEDGESLC